MDRTAIANLLVELYKKYKDHMDIDVYYDLEKQKLVSVIDRDESYLRSGAECEYIVTCKKNWTNNCQLNLSEFLDPEELVQFDEFMKKKYNLEKYESEFIGNIDDIEDFLDEKFYERLEEYFGYYLDEEKI